MTTHLRARAAQAGAFLALIGGILAVASAPAFADQPGVQITNMSSTELPSGGRTTMTYSVTNTNQGQGGGPDQIRIQVTGMTCSGACSPATVIQPGESQQFTVQLTAPSVAAGATKTVQVQITAQQGRDTGTATQAVTVRGPDKPTTVRQVTGRVRDSAGKAMAGATVGIRDSQGHNYTTTTTGDGRFQFTSTDQAPILAGALSVGAVKQGYSPVTVSVQGQAGRVINVPLVLKGGPVVPSAIPSSVLASAPEELPSDQVSEPAVAAATTAATNAANNSGGSGSLLFIIIGALLVAAGVGAIVLVTMRRKNNNDDDQGQQPAYAGGGGGVVPPSRGAYHDATRVAAPMGGRNDATMAAGRGLSDAPTMMHQAVPPDDEFPDPYGAPVPQYGNQYAGTPTQFGQDTGPYAAYGAGGAGGPSGGYGGDRPRYDEPTGMYRPESGGAHGGYGGGPADAGGGSYGHQQPGDGSWGAPAGDIDGGNGYGAPAGGREYGSGPYGGGNYGGGGSYGASYGGDAYGAGAGYGGNQGSQGGGYSEPDGGYGSRGGNGQRGSYGDDYGGSSQYGGAGYSGAEHGGSQYDGAEYGGSQHGGPEYGGSQHGGPEYGGSQHDGPEYGGSQHGGQGGYAQGGGEYDQRGASTYGQGGRHGGQSPESESTRPGQRRSLDWLDD